VSEARVLACPRCARYVRARGGRCARCLSPLVEARPRFPEDVFGEPEPGDDLRTRRLPPPTTHRRPGLGPGVGLCFLLHFLQIPLNSLWPGALFFIGFSQYAYLVPAMIVAGLVRRGHLASGMALGSLITILLNIACFGVVCGQMELGL
jgi:hypothetical protein